MSGFDSRGGGTSYLVRMWREPPGDSSTKEPARVFVRDLRNGEERYLKSVEDLAEYLDRQHRLHRGAGVDADADVDPDATGDTRQVG